MDPLRTAVAQLASTLAAAAPAAPEAALVEAQTTLEAAPCDSKLQHLQHCTAAGEGEAGPSGLPTIFYFAFQVESLGRLERHWLTPGVAPWGQHGRAEPLRMALAAAGVPFRFEAVEGAEFKCDLEHYRFGQARAADGVPRYVDDEVDLVQSGAILRHIARKHGLYGISRAEEARVDEVIEGADNLATTLFSEGLSKGGPAARENWLVRHWHAASVNAPTTQGAHAAFLSRLLAASSSGWFVESGLTVADILMACVVQLCFRVYGRERIGHQWPNLQALHDRVLALPRIQDYRHGPQCLPLIAPLLP